MYLYAPVIGAMTLLDTNTFLACFIAGVTMSWDDEVAEVLHTKVRLPSLLLPSSSQPVLSLISCPSVL